MDAHGPPSGYRTATGSHSRCDLTATRTDHQYESDENSWKDRPLATSRPGRHLHFGDVLGHPPGNRGGLLHSAARWEGCRRTLSGILFDLPLPDLHCPHPLLNPRSLDTDVLPVPAPPYSSHSQSLRHTEAPELTGVSMQSLHFCLTPACF